jgi:hypothetical protein
MFASKLADARRDSTFVRHFTAAEAGNLAVSPRPRAMRRGAFAHGLDSIDCNGRFLQNAIANDSRAARRSVGCRTHLDSRGAKRRCAGDARQHHSRGCRRLQRHRIFGRNAEAAGAASGNHGGQPLHPRLLGRCTGRSAHGFLLRNAGRGLELYRSAAGSYALAILHATGVSKPQQISFILSETPDHRWKLGGFFSKPMMQAGHDGLWYWASARKFAQRNMNWDAWFYYRAAADTLDPVDFLSSPNLEKLQQEEQKVHPASFPTQQQPLMIGGQGSVFQVTSIDTTVTFGPLDLEVHYTPDPSQAALLRDPPMARKQVTAVMTALLAMHPEFESAFHGIWVQADAGSASLFSLELPMDQLVPGTHLSAIDSNNLAR